MNVEQALKLIELALGVATLFTAGTPVAGDVRLAQGLEEIAVTAARNYKAHTGQPLDTSLLLDEPPIS